MKTTAEQLKQAKKDIRVLLREVSTIEHMQDDRAIDEIAKRYRIDRFKLLREDPTP